MGLYLEIFMFDMVQDIIFFVTNAFREYFSDCPFNGAAVHFIQPYEECRVPNEKCGNRQHAEGKNNDHK